MKKVVMALLLIPVKCAFGGGFDDMIQWRYEAPIMPKGQFSLAPNQVYRKSSEILLLHSNPYALSSLNWDYAALKYGAGRWGVFGKFRSYTLSNLYADYATSLGTAYEFSENLAISASGEYGNMKFGDAVSYSSINLNLGLSYSRRNMAGVIAVNRINLKKPYEHYGNAEPMVIGSIDLGEGMIFSTGFRKQANGEGRWYIKQDIGIIDNIDLQLGYLNNPNILQWGLDLSWRSFRLGVGYMAISRLNDTLIMGLSWGAE
jgi:hypothetical protein